ncbi:hypothetical protein GOP47_0030115 [Adiantum capillus-veneris]|nr:hypothetical protein GOP47_0030115 [Adiantum capillus-veneris]
MANNSARCYPPMPAVSNGILQGDLPVNFALPLLTLQIAIVLLVTRTTAALFKPIKQPQVLAEIVGGVLLGPTALGRINVYMQTLFPAKSLPLLETVATIGLMFFIFMVGMNLDLQVLRKIGRKALIIAATGISVPFIVSIGLACFVRSTIAKEVRLAPLLIFMGAPISISAFSVLVRIMAELKLLSTDIAKLAIPIAALNDVTIWTLLAVGVAIAGGGHGKGPLTPVFVILCAVGFGIFMFTVGRKAMGVVARRATRPEGGESSDLYVCITLMSVLGAGFCSDAVGVHALLGPFLLGLVLPKDNPFPKMITEKIEDFVTGLFLPLFFASSGLKTNLGTLHGVNSIGFLALFFCTAAFGKILASFVAARLIGLPNRRALILGFLLNTKGLAVLIVLNIGRDLKALTDELFAILVLTALLTSFVTTPVVAALCKPGIGGELLKVEQGGRGGRDGSSKSMHSTLSTYKRRQGNNPHCSLASLLHNTSNGSSSKKGSHPQLRILACAYEPDNHSSFINLLEASRGIKPSPLKLYPLKLSLLSGRPSALFMLTPSPLDAPPITTTTNTTTIGPLSPLSFPPSPSLSKVTVRPLSFVSSLDSMHDDICKIATQKRTALILLPYHKPPTHNISMFGDPSFFKVTQKVLDHAPCSIGILVDRGSMGISPIHPSFFSYKVVVLFVGGPDDREALFTGSRMIGHPGVALKLVRFIRSSSINHHTNNLQVNNNNLYSFEEVDDEQEEPPNPPPSNNLKADFEGAKESTLDGEAIAMVKEIASESSFVYEEVLVTSGQSVVEAVKAFTKGMNEVNMFIVGRGRLRPELSTNSLSHDQQNANNHHIQGEQLSELGVLGDVLASSSGLEFHACILVVQQHMSDCADKKATCKTVATMPSIPRPQSPSFEISAAP